MILGQYRNNWKSIRVFIYYDLRCTKDQTGFYLYSSKNSIISISPKNQKKNWLAFYFLMTNMYISFHVFVRHKWRWRLDLFFPVIPIFPIHPYYVSDLRCVGSFVIFRRNMKNKMLIKNRLRSRGCWKPAKRCLLTVMWRRLPIIHN